MDMKKNSDDKNIELVRAGYNKIAGHYTKERVKFDNWEELEEFYGRLPEKAKVLDAGSGTGVPVAKYLAENGCNVIGIDISKNMTAVAAQNVPDASFIQMNMTEIDFPPESFDGVVSCFAIFHVPRERHSDIFRAFHSMLKSGGATLVSVAWSEWEEVADYLGVDMFWSHFDPATSESLVTDAGFEIEFGRTIEAGGEKHHWILARKG